MGKIARQLPYIGKNVKRVIQTYQMKKHTIKRSIREKRQVAFCYVLL